MGSSFSSSLKRQGSTPSIAYGRGLRVSETSSARGSPHYWTPPARWTSSRAQQHDHDINGYTKLPRATSWHAVTEQTALLSSSSGGFEPLQLSRQLKHSHSSASLPSEAAASAPPLSIWIVPALLCALSYAMYNIFIKKGSASIHPVLGGVILQLVAAFLGIFLLLFITVKENTDLYYDYHGVQWAICAGISVGMAEMISFFVSSLGVQAMQSIPIIIGGSVLSGTLLGFVLLGEVLSLQGWIGVGMLVGGICLVGTDPAATEYSE